MRRKRNPLLTVLCIVFAAEVLAAAGLFFLSASRPDRKAPAEPEDLAVSAEGRMEFPTVQPPPEQGAGIGGEEVPAEATEDQRRFVISLLGDCTLSSSHYTNHFESVVGDDLAYPFSNVAEILTADDLTLANLECSFSNRRLESSSEYAFCGQAKYAESLVLGGVEQYMDAAIQHGLTPAHLEELADQLDLGLLSPVVTPRPDPEPVRTPNPPAGERTDARRTYAALLRDLCNSGVLPDGQTAEMDPTYDTFAVLDVDGDDREELILLHTSGITAGMTGYVIDFDEGYTGGGAPIYIQMSDYPIFTFYSSGYMTAGASHNQGWAGEVLWPYSLYRHTEGDRYACIATLDAWDPDIWPDAYGEGSEARQVHRRSGGPVYFVSYTYASELPDDQRFLVLDKAGYEAWLENLDLGRQLDIRTLPLTEENIAAMEQASPITAGSLASADLPTDVSQGVTVLGSYLFPLTVDGERSLTLRANCRAVASGYGYWDYGVESMEVLENGELLQTLKVSDAQLLSYGEEGIQVLGEGGWTQGWESDYLPECRDLSFDGSDDIRLLDYRGVVNGRYLHWLWNSKTGQFEYAFTLVGYDFEVDWGTKQLRTTARNGGDHTTEVYTYDKNGNLFLVNVLDVSPDD